MAFSGFRPSRFVLRPQKMNQQVSAEAIPQPELSGCECSITAEAACCPPFEAAKDASGAHAIWSRLADGEDKPDPQQRRPRRQEFPKDPWIRRRVPAGMAQPMNQHK